MTALITKIEDRVASVEASTDAKMAEQLAAADAMAEHQCKRPMCMETILHQTRALGNIGCRNRVGTVIGNCHYPMLSLIHI